MNSTPQNHPPKAAIRLEPFTLWCGKCSAVADTIHLFDDSVVADAGPIRVMSGAEFMATDFPPEPDAVLRIEAACPTHSPGGYCIQLNGAGAGLWDEGRFGWDDWAWHLSGKPGNWWAPLLRWLQERQMTRSENAVDTATGDWEDITLQALVNADTCLFCGVSGHRGNCKAEWLELAAAARDKGATEMPVPATATCPWCRVAGGHADTCEVKPAAPKPKPFGVPVREWAAQAPEAVEWVWQQYIARGDLVELDGAAKRSGKSTLIWHLVKAMETGADYLGWATARGHVVVLSEMAGSSLREQLEAAGILGAENLTLVLYNEWSSEPWEDIAARAIAKCQEVDAALLVIDTLPKWAKIRGDQGNSEGAWLERMQELEPLHGSQTAVALLCHDRKSGGAVAESGAGSTARVGAMDTVLRLSRIDGGDNSRNRKLEALGQHTDTPEQQVISLTPNGYVTLGSEPAAVKQWLGNEIREVMANGEPWTFPELKKATDGADSTVRRALEWLVDANLIFKIPGANQNKPATYKLVPVGIFHKVTAPMTEALQISTSPIERGVECL